MSNLHIDLESYLHDFGEFNMVLSSSPNPISARGYLVTPTSQYIGPLDSSGSFKYETSEECYGKDVHFYVTVLAPPNDSACAIGADPAPWSKEPTASCTSDSWISEFKCSHGSQEKTATISNCEKHECIVNTNDSGKTTFNWHITSTATLNADGTSPDAGVILLVTTNSTT